MDDEALNAGTLAAKQKTATSPEGQNMAGSRCGNLVEEDPSKASPVKVERKYNRRQKEPMHLFRVQPKLIQSVQKSKRFVDHRYVKCCCATNERDPLLIFYWNVLLTFPFAIIIAVTMSSQSFHPNSATSFPRRSTK